MEPEVYENAEGADVEWDDLDEYEQQYYENDVRGIDIAEYVENCERGGSGISIDDEGNFYED